MGKGEMIVKLSDFIGESTEYLERYGDMPQLPEKGQSDIIGCVKKNLNLQSFLHTAIFKASRYLYRALNSGLSCDIGALLSISCLMRSSAAAILRHSSRTGPASS